jgi:hypothetical protein
MVGICENPYKQFAPIYKELGFWPRPLSGKRCFELQWQLPNEQLPTGTLEKWIKEKPSHNIGLVAGSPFPDGTRLGFLDIDHDSFIQLGKVLLGNPVCVRYGKKGVVIPFRYEDGLSAQKKIKTKAKFEIEEVAEIFLENCYCAIPPSIHPDINKPYKWQGPALHEIDFQL